MKFDIAPQVKEIIGVLNAHTYKAYLVGDCIRAMIQGENPRDFDIVTDAEPERITAIFEEKYKTAPGSKTGEIIIINGAMGISVSPLHGIDENGRPVCGAKGLTLEDELRQRVYSADAIAYDPEKGLYDPFDGVSCVSENKVMLRAIGEKEAETENAQPERKNDKKTIIKSDIPALTESPVTALNAIKRFSSGGVAFSAPTLRSLCENRYRLLEAYPRDRLLDTLHDIIMGKKITDTLLAFRPFVFTLIPKLAETDGYAQRSSFHEYSLYEHIARAVGYAVPDYTVRLALLLHGIGKRDCEADRGGYNTYDGHDERGAMLAREVMKEFSVPENIAAEVIFLILHHDDPVDETNYTSYTAEYGIPSVKKLLLLQSANIRAKRPEREYEQRAAELRALSDSLYRPPTGNTGRGISTSELKRVINGM